MLLLFAFRSTSLLAWRLHIVLLLLSVDFFVYVIFVYNFVESAVVHFKCSLNNLIVYIKSMET